MIDGWLIINAFLHAEKFSQLYDWLVLAGSSLGVRLKVKTNSELMIELQDDSMEMGHPVFAIFWDKDIRLAELLEQRGLRLFNCARAIELCDDKSKTFTSLFAAGLPLPRTMIVPMTYNNVGFTSYEFLYSAVTQIGLPLIAKEAIGSFGQQVNLIDNVDDLRTWLEKHAGESLLLQQFVEAAAGSDLRLQVVGDEVIGAMRRTAAIGDFRANLTLGGSMQKWIPDKKQTDVAVAACKVLGLDFAGVDLLLDADDEPLICEVNSNAHFKTLFDCTGVDTADAIIKYIIRSIK